MTDYLIVGAGSAGAALAGRLSEDPSVDVTLLEAGPDWRTADGPDAMRGPNPFTLFGDAWFSEINWHGVMAVRSRVQQPLPYPRGRGLGGSSTINGQFAIRPEPGDMDRWAAMGCTGWAWDDVLPAFTRLEADLDFGHQPYHGSDGPTPIRRSAQADIGPVDRALRDAASDLGYPWCDDHNAPGTTGVGPYAFNADAAGRVTTNDAYLEPARSRPNLHIRGDALVARVVIEHGRAVGVELIGGEVVRGAEVIVCGGAVHSPAILLRSGIGPAPELARLGIDVVADLPVGEQLQDHAWAMIAFPLRDPDAYGPVARHSNTCLRYTSGIAGAGTNDMFIAGMNFVFTGVNAASLGCWVNEVVSRGRIHLPSADPLADPVVHQDMLSASSDLERARDGFARIRELFAHRAFADIAAGEPGLVDLTLLSDIADEDVDDALVRTILDTQHACGTCRMGSPDDATTVVDPDCRVLGVDGLRVCDASIFPEVPRANTNLTAIMVGEHLAARIAARSRTVTGSS